MRFGPMQGYWAAMSENADRVRWIYAEVRLRG